MAMQDAPSNVAAMTVTTVPPTLRRSSNGPSQLGAVVRVSSEAGTVWLTLVHAVPYAVENKRVA